VGERDRPAVALDEDVLGLEVRVDEIERVQESEGPGPQRRRGSSEVVGWQGETDRRSRGSKEPSSHTPSWRAGTSLEDGDGDLLDACVGEVQVLSGLLVVFLELV